MKIAIVLFNLGGPDSKEAIEPFLMNFFMDRNIIRAPFIVRWVLAKIISKKRSKKEAKESYKELAYQSPLLKNSQEQANALENLLNEDKTHKFKCVISMRYWNPRTKTVIQKIKNYAPDKIILLPLYPQFSTTTTKSSFEEWDKESRKQNLNVTTSKINSYPTQEGFIQASADKILSVYKKSCKKYTKYKPPRVLFSAHGLPEKIINSGDPYQKQCELTVQSIVKEMNLENLDWQICYQSRVGYLKWIGPSVKEALKQAKTDGVPVVIYPHSFTQEHAETLVEIDIEYREMAEQMGLIGFEKVDTVGTHTKFIKGLSDLVYQTLKQDQIVSK